MSKIPGTQPDGSGSVMLAVMRQVVVGRLQQGEQPFSQADMAAITKAQDLYWDTCSSDQVVRSGDPLLELLKCISIDTDPEAALELIDAVQSGEVIQVDWDVVEKDFSIYHQMERMEQQEFQIASRRLQSGSDRSQRGESNTPNH